jgi:hypothetical protein
MKKSLLKLITGIILTSNFLTAAGNFTIVGEIGGLLGSDSSTNAPVGSVGVLVSDLGSGFATANEVFNSTFTVGGSLGSSSNRILAVYDLEDFGGFTGINFNTLSVNIEDGISVGDQLGFYWFPTLSNSDTVLFGTEYGFIRTDLILSNSGADAAWIVPSAGSTVNLSIFADSLTGSSDGISDSVVSASLTAVPEPATYAALVGLLALGFVVTRRARR